MNNSEQIWNFEQISHFPHTTANDEADSLSTICKYCRGIMDLLLKVNLIRSKLYQFSQLINNNTGFCDGVHLK